MQMLQKDGSGFTLVELMVAMVIGSMVMAGIYGVYNAQVKSHVTQEVAVEMQQNLRNSMYYMKRSIRMAGYDPTGSGVPGITVAERAFIEFTMDFNEDGDVDDNEERIRYYLSNDADGDGIADDIDAPSSPSHLLREHWDGDSWEPVSDDEKIIAENIDALNFVYLDGDGTDSLTDYLNLDPPAVPAAAPDLRGEIRSVQITIVARGGANIQVLPDKEVDSNVYMNQQIRPGDDWDIVLPAQNDLFRRNLLSAEVRCRNLGLEVN